jgi:hypothetical protein
MTIYSPYTYLIGWSKLDKWYYGVRFAKKSYCLYESGCHPDELWVTYFTSSEIVEEFRRLHGRPDIIQIRKTFDNKEDAIEWEYKVLRRLNVEKNPKWLNMSDSKSIPAYENWSDEVKKEHSKKISKGNKKTKNSIEWKETTGIQQKEKVSKHHKERFNRPIVKEIKILLKTYRIKLHQGWPNHNDDKLNQLLNELKVQVSLLTPWKKDQVARRKVTMEAKKQRPIIFAIRELRQITNIKLSQGWWQKSDEELEQLFDTLQNSCP